VNDMFFTLDWDFALRVTGLEQAVEGGVCKLLAIHTQRSEAGMGVSAELDAVVADHGDVFGDAQAVLVDGAHGPDGGEVVRAEDGGGRRARGKDAPHRLVAAVHAMVALLDHARVVHEALSIKHRFKSVETDASRIKRERAADESDLPMPVIDQVLHSGGDACRIVYADAADPRAGRARIQEDERDMAAAEHLDQAIIHLRRHDRDAIDLALQHAPDAGLHTRGIVVGVGDEHLLLVLNGDVLKGLDDLGKEGIGDIGDDEAVEAGATGAEGARIGVRVKTKRVDGTANALGSSWTDVRGSVNGAGDGGGGDPGFSSDSRNVHRGQRATGDPTATGSPER